MFWDKKTETLKPGELKELQIKRLKKTINQAQHVEFYRNLLSDAGVKPSFIKTLEDIQKIPFTKKLFWQEIGMLLMMPSLWLKMKRRWYANFWSLGASAKKSSSSQTRPIRLFTNRRI